MATNIGTGYGESKNLGYFNTIFLKDKQFDLTKVEWGTKATVIADIKEEGKNRIIPLAIAHKTAFTDNTAVGDAGDISEYFLFTKGGAKTFTYLDVPLEYQAEVLKLNNKKMYVVFGTSLNYVVGINSASKLVLEGIYCDVKVTFMDAAVDGKARHMNIIITTLNTDFYLENATAVKITDYDLATLKGVQKGVLSTAPGTFSATKVYFYFKSLDGIDLDGLLVADINFTGKTTLAFDSVTGIYTLTGVGFVDGTLSLVNAAAISDLELLFEASNILTVDIP